MPPEYIMEGTLSTKYDVYSFGVILLEIISSMCNLKPARRQASVEWVSSTFKWQHAYTTALVCYRSWISTGENLLQSAILHLLVPVSARLPVLAGILSCLPYHMVYFEGLLSCSRNCLLGKNICRGPVPAKLLGNRTQVLKCLVLSDPHAMFPFFSQMVPSNHITDHCKSIVLPVDTTAGLLRICGTGG